MKLKSQFFGLALSVFLASPILYAGSDISSELTNQLQKEIDAYYKKYSKKEKFTAIAASVLIPQNQVNDKKEVKTVVHGTMGYPPLSQPITPNNLFDIGSITKSFTALILLQLQTEDKLTLDDPLGKWLPQYPNWKNVTLRQLLNMTSGIPNYSEDDEFSKEMESHLDKVWTDEELLKYAHPEKPLKKKKGNLFEYSNSNYILAALVIEKITNDTFVNQLKLRIINSKNGLHNSFYLAGPDGQSVGKAIEDRRVHGYLYDEEKNKLIDTLTNDLSWAAAAGAIVATPEDVVHWVQLLYRGTLIKPDFRERILAELESVVSMKTGQPIPEVTKDDPYGFGLGVGYLYDTDLKQSFWIYKGSTLGFRVMYFWQPCNNVTTVVALNSKGGEGNPDSKLGDKIIEANQNLYKVILKNYPELQCIS
ncbi:serine hydrolase domain-containing protein [Legionella anisa]|uniref:D-alanyl-D-alanine carboxypeptidase n=1 Tax=Legionella anisa TaxID=28082 RepID=A0AAX0WSN6_9GAMM|nr:serine hydrolase domain-containing protein [Legionella anisa]AWN74622.1 D-alanyl-D-alanine carboxypeptidase [Legionella anisa]KTC76230.1 D-alanyl-D-alanine carboxypeptidase [Legionella anisa]MCW8425260.1 beta-lactamase family protein [Legionella anisa]MCW8449310.1 beta-lactamase family protein [Legionella anisa]PNL61483.1 D-alanyl-D-alanine carboxypeptidase [Legionella anisa]